MTGSILDQYEQAKSWSVKAALMELYHTMMITELAERGEVQTIKDTAKYFKCSVGLVCENLKLAKRIHYDPKFIEIKTRTQALAKL